MYQEYAAQELAKAQQLVIDARDKKRYWRHEAVREADTSGRVARRRMSLQGRSRLAILALILKQRFSPTIEGYNRQNQMAPR